MGKYINIGNAEFESVRKDEYVDKSMLIAYVNKVLGTQRKFLCVTRARRFGRYLSYSRAESSCCIPNQEVRQEFESTIQATDWSGLAEAVRNSAQLLRDTLAGNSEAVAKAIESVHQNNTSILQYNDENALSYVVSLAYQAGQLYYHFVRELPTGKGFADIVMLPRIGVNKPAIVVELKYDQSANAAIDQIKTKGYAQSLKEYAGEVVLVGINYDKKTKKHECVIERLSDKISDKFPINGNFSQKTSDKLQKILLCMQSGNGVITQAEVSSMFGVSDRQARNYLDALVEQGYVLRMGANKDRTYKLK